MTRSSASNLTPAGGAAGEPGKRRSACQAGPAGVEDQAAAWKRTRAWAARPTTRSGPSTAGNSPGIFGRRRAATTGTPSVTTLPERIGAPCTAERECRCWAIMSAAKLEPSVEVIHPLQVMLLTVDLA